MRFVICCSKFEYIDMFSRFVFAWFAQNELILVSVLDVIYETIMTLLRGQLDRRTIMDNLELVLLTIDEVVRVYVKNFKLRGYQRPLMVCVFLLLHYRSIMAISWS